MTDLYEKFTRGAWLAVPLLICAAIVFFGRVEYDAHRVLTEYAGSGVLVKQNLKIIGGAGTDLEKTLRDEHAADADQLKTAAALARNFAQLLQDTDGSLNGAHGALPTLTAAIAHQDANMTTLAASADAAIDQLDATLADAKPLLAAATAAAQNAATLAGDPAMRAQIQQALEQLNAAMAKTNVALASADSILASGDRDAGMLETRLRQALKPASLAKEIFERVLQIGPPIATAVRVP